MVLRQLSILALIIFLASAPARAQHETSALVEGVLLIGEFFGPPNYGENSKQDKVERLYYLQLPANLKMQLAKQRIGSKFVDDLSQHYFVQLIITNSNNEMTHKLVGKRVQVSGSLIEAESGHHRTSILVQVKSLVEVKSWDW